MISRLARRRSECFTHLATMTLPVGDDCEPRRTLQVSLSPRRFWPTLALEETLAGLGYFRSPHAKRYKYNPTNPGAMVDPLEKLVVDDEEIDRTLLSEVLAPYVRISKKAGQPVFTPEFSRLSEGGKILVYLLARQAATTLGLSSEGSAATPKEVSASTGVKYGTAKPTLVGLVRKGFLSSVGGEYSVPAHALLRIREAIK